MVLVTIIWEVTPYALEDIESKLTLLYNLFHHSSACMHNPSFSLLDSDLGYD